MFFGHAAKLRAQKEQVYAEVRSAETITLIHTHIISPLSLPMARMPA